MLGVALDITDRAAPAIPDAVMAAEPITTAYVPVGPVQLADTRDAGCGCARLDGSTLRVDIVGRDRRQDWFDDGIHVNRAGAYAITDYVARWIAALEHRPCPRPWVVGGDPPDPCPAPDLLGPVPDPIAVNP